jgi:hypothetical protein
MPGEPGAAEPGRGARDRGPIDDPRLDTLAESLVANWADAADQLLTKRAHAVLKAAGRA